MARLFIEADSLTTEELRAGLAALSMSNRRADIMVPADMSRTDGDGRAFVGLNGPECWTMRTIAVHPEQAISIVEAIAHVSRTKEPTA